MRFLAVLELFKQGWIDLDQPDDLRRAHRSSGSGTDDVDRADLAFVDVYDG